MRCLVHAHLSGKAIFLSRFAVVMAIAYAGFFVLLASFFFFRLEIYSFQNSALGLFLKYSKSFRRFQAG